MPNGQPYTDWEDEIIRKLWPTTTSASQIAQQLTPGRTRNSVISRVGRLKLGAKPLVGSPKPKVKDSARKKPTLAPLTKTAGASTTVTAESDAREPIKMQGKVYKLPDPILSREEALALEPTATFAEITDHQCHYIRGESSHRDGKKFIVVDQRLPALSTAKIIPNYSVLNRPTTSRDASRKLGFHRIETDCHQATAAPQTVWGVFLLFDRKP